MTKAAELAKMGEVLTNSQIGGRRNIAYNGAMNVAQRGNQNTSDGYNAFGVDRFSLYLRGGAAATVSQDTDVPAGQGFSSSCKIDITTADALGVANDLALFRQTFEGQDLQQLKKGTSNAEKVTVSFWIKSTITGTYILELLDNDNTRGISKSYTVNSSNTWEHKTITFEGDTTGAFDNDNLLSLYLMWGLGVGTDYKGETLSTSWASISDSDARYEGQVNAVNSASNNIYFTGIQMEVGSVATPFEHRSFGEELRLCQRYFNIEKDGAGGNYKRYAHGGAHTTVQGSCAVPLSTPLRAIPTIILSGNVNTFLAHSAAGLDALTSLIIATDSDGGTFNNQIEITPVVSSGLVAGDALAVISNNSDSTSIAFDAEL
jgi:hypothetical protein